MIFVTISAVLAENWHAFALTFSSSFFQMSPTVPSIIFGVRFDPVLPRLAEPPLGRLGCFRTLLVALLLKRALNFSFPSTLCDFRSKMKFFVTAHLKRRKTFNLTERRSALTGELSWILLWKTLEKRKPSLNLFAFEKTAENGRKPLLFFFLPLIDLCARRMRFYFWPKNPIYLEKIEFSPFFFLCKRILSFRESLWVSPREMP